MNLYNNQNHNGMELYEFDIDGVIFTAETVGVYCQDGGYYEFVDGYEMFDGMTSWYGFRVTAEGFDPFFIEAKWYDEDEVESKIRRHLSK